MGNAADFIPAFAYGHKLYPDNIVDSGLPLDTGRVWYVDGDRTTGGAGGTWEDAFYLTQDAINAASAGDVILIAARTMTALVTDPVSYDEHLTITNAKSNLSLIGVSRGLTQGGLPQIKPSTVVTGDILKIYAPGCLIANLGFNGAGITEDAGYSGINLYDDGGTTGSTFGTTITNCHFKNLGRGHPGTSAYGAINVPLGGSWQLRISNSRFYKCLGGINLASTAIIPQDWIIENCWFGSAANTDVDCDIFAKGGGDGVTGININNCMFATVDVPTHGSGSVARYLDLTGCKGMLSNCTFACKTNESATPKTFVAAGTAGLVPATVRMANCHGETSLDGTNEIGEIARAA